MHCSDFLFRYLFHQLPEYWPLLTVRRGPLRELLAAVLSDGSIKCKWFIQYQAQAGPEITRKLHVQMAQTSILPLRLPLLQLTPMPVAAVEPPLSTAHGGEERHVWVTDGLALLVGEG